MSQFTFYPADAILPPEVETEAPAPTAAPTDPADADPVSAHIEKPAEAQTEIGTQAQKQNDETVTGTVVGDPSASDQNAKTITSLIDALYFIVPVLSAVLVVLVVLLIVSIVKKNKAKKEKANSVNNDSSSDPPLRHLNNQDR